MDVEQEMDVDVVPEIPGWHVVTSTGTLSTFLGTWREMGVEAGTLSNLTRDSERPIRMQLIGIKGTGAPRSDTTALLADTQHWVVASLSERCKSDLFSNRIDVQDVLEIVTTQGFLNNLLIVSCCCLICVFFLLPRQSG